MRLIDADALKEDLTKWFPQFTLEGIEPKTLFAQIMRDIDNAPTVETDIEAVAKDAYEHGYTDGWKERYGELDERPQGEWIEKVETKQLGHGWLTTHEIVCSNCGKDAEWLDGGSQLLSKFCPNCGADMRGEEL